METVTVQTKIGEVEVLVDHRERYNNSGSIWEHTYVRIPWRHPHWRFTRHTISILLNPPPSLKTKTFDEIVLGILEESGYYNEVVEVEETGSNLRLSNNTPCTRNEQTTFLIMKELQKREGFGQLWDQWGNEICGEILDSITSIIDNKE